MSTLTIGIPGFFLALAPDDARARRGFTRRVARFTIPTGVAAAAATFSTYLAAGAMPATTHAQARSAATLALFAVGIWVLVLVAMPLTRWRVALVTVMAAAIVAPFAVPRIGRVFALVLPAAPVILVAAAIVASSIGGLTLWRRAAARRPARARPPGRARPRR